MPHHLLPILVRDFVLAEEEVIGDRDFPSPRLSASAEYLHHTCVRQAWRAAERAGDGLSGLARFQSILDRCEACFCYRGVRRLKTDQVDIHVVGSEAELRRAA